MSARRSTASLAIAVALGIAGPPAAWSSEAAERMLARRAQLESFRKFYERRPAGARARLSSGVLNLLALGRTFDRRLGALERAETAWGSLGARGARGESIAPLALVGPAPLPTGKISNPARDMAYSNLAGFTQSTTSTAWCGANAVVGYNDSGSYLETLYGGPGGSSFNGVSRSINKGLGYFDLGFLNPAGSANASLAGDPVLGCTDPNTFYYASLYEDGTSPTTCGGAPDAGSGCSAVSVSKSTDGGATFSDPALAASKPAFDSLTSTPGHFLDKEWMAVDPTNANNLYVTYTDFDSTGSICGTTTTSGAPLGNRTGIELVKSTDGGGTWSVTPVQLTNASQSCDSNFDGSIANQASQVVVDSAGHVYVSWEHFDFASATGREIDFAASTDGGLSFSAPARVTDVNCAGDCNTGLGLEGHIASNEYPTMAVDRSGIAGKDGHVYIAWTEGEASFANDDAEFYQFTDILFTGTADGGATWSAPVRVNNNVETVLTPPPNFIIGPGWGLTSADTSTRGTDQFMPAMAVDKTGAIGICFYDRRRDKSNFLIDRECAKSVNLGLSWTNSLKTAKQFKATAAQDGLFSPDYWGDYDSLASDFTKVNSGFRGGYQETSLGNPDVKLNIQ